ncbi:MAG: MalM family protein [Pseudomonadota bacterium]
MRLPALLLGLLAACAQGAGGRYLTWIDDQGRLHNTFVDDGYLQQQRQAARRVELNDKARTGDPAGRGWPGSPAGGESKRRYYTWVDAGGTLQNSFYAGDRQRAAGQQVERLDTGELTRDYIDADVLEGRGFVPEGQAQAEAYYTWVDEQGRMRNAPVGSTPPAPRTEPAIRFTEGRQIEFARTAPRLPGLDGQPSDALRELLTGSQAQGEGLYPDLLEHCCGQLAETAFTELSADQPRYAELDRFSPSFDFPMGRSHYVAIKLPSERRTYGLRVRSFANKQLVYPSLLFLDAAKRPTRLVSDAVYQLHGETWYRYAYIEGTVQPGEGERYVLLLTTDQDRSLRTLDNQAFKRPLQALDTDASGLQSHAHVDQGSFELAIMR